MDINTFNEVLEVPHVTNVAYLAKAQVMDIKWLWNTLILEAERDQIY